MKYSERRQFIYDHTLFARGDVKTALGIHHEYITKNSATPRPVFYEVDRSAGASDAIWHGPISGQEKFSRQLELPCLIKFESRRWNQTKVGSITSQTAWVWVSHLQLKESDYFPTPGDLVLWAGQRFEVVQPDNDPTLYWLQTNVWLGMKFILTLAPVGDIKPAASPLPSPAEVGNGVPTIIPADKSKLPANPIPSVQAQSYAFPPPK